MTPSCAHGPRRPRRAHPRRHRGRGAALAGARRGGGCVHARAGGRPRPGCRHHRDRPRRAGARAGQGRRGRVGSRRPASSRTARTSPHRSRPARSTGSSLPTASTSSATAVSLLVAIRDRLATERAPRRRRVRRGSRQPLGPAPVRVRHLAPRGRRGRVRRSDPHPPRPEPVPRGDLWRRDRAGRRPASRSGPPNPACYTPALTAVTERSRSGTAPSERGTVRAARVRRSEGRSRAVRLAPDTAPRARRTSRPR